MYKYNDEYLFKSPKGASLLTTEALQKTKQQIHKLFQEVFQPSTPDTKNYRIIHAKKAEELITPLVPLAQHIRESFETVVVIAMGGATLAPQTIISLACQPQPKFIFLDSTDPVNFNNTIKLLPLEKTAFLVISKSGQTMETISLFGAVVTFLRNAGVKNINQHCFFITEPGNSPLRKIAQELGSPILEHDVNVGGRFSTFTNVALLPGLIAGLDMFKFIGGVNHTAHDFWSNQEDSLPCQAAAALFNLNQPIWPIIGYLKSFEPFIDWYIQIIAESLGKDGKGFTPTKGIGPMDQHAILQLYLDGPKDKVFTMLYVKETDENATKVSPEVYPQFLQNKSLASINHALFSATCQSLQQSGCPLRTITLDKFDELSLGAFWMHAALEVITLGHLMEINPFDQPGVEQIKVGAQSLLSS
jgi:glucose-6-phosphate isomerase